MELRQYASVIWKWWWLIVLATVVAAGSSFLATRNQPLQYQAKTTLMVGPALDKSNTSTQDIALGQQLGPTYVELTQRAPVRQAAMEALGLSFLPQYFAAMVGNTQLLEIRVQDTDPQRAAAVANELANQLVLQSPADRQQRELDRYRPFVMEQLARLEKAMETTEEEITTLSESVDDMFSAREIADAWSQITALGEKYAAYQNGYTQLLGMLGEGSPSLLSVIEPATVPANPVGARKELTVLLAGAIGCALAMGGAFLLEYLDDTLKTAEDVTESLGLSTLGAIVRIEGETIHDILVTADRRLSPVSEAYRSLRTNLQFSSLDEPLQSLLVTSATAVEGKSVTVANLGVVMAQAGLSVIIVDGDLRRPVLHRVFQVPNDEGLSGALLRSNPSLDGHLQATEVDNLRLLPTGPLPPNPSELLGSRRMKALVQELESQSDLLIFDSSPCLAVTDAAVLASQVDGVLLVVEAGATRRGAALQALESLKGVGANVVGVVLTKVPPRTHSYYRYGYYSRGSDKRSRRRRRGKAVG